MLESLKNPIPLRNDAGPLSGLQRNALASLVHFVTHTTKRTRDAGALRWRPERGLASFRSGVGFLRLSNLVLFVYFFQLHPYSKWSFFRKFFPLMKKKEILDDLEKFFRRLCLKEFFLEEEEKEESDVQTLFCPPSTLMPPKRRDTALETCTNQTRIDAERQLERLQDKRSKDNLPSDKRLALGHLRQCTDVLIKPADKGSAVVALNREDYIKEADRQLNEFVFYLNLSTDPTSQPSMEEEQCVDSMFKRVLINKREKDFPVPHLPWAARFYLLPKIHKPGNPERPIVASNVAPTENISHFADFYLRSSVIRPPSYIRDTTDFINKLRRLSRLPSGCLLVTLDISSLYTNIPHEEGITACEEFLNRWEIQEPPMTDLCQLIRLVLSKNSFVFNNIKYIQIHGTAIGTHKVSSYANLLMEKLKWELLRTQSKLPRVWWRYLDDISTIWTHGEPSLWVFIENLNCHHPTIKFTASWLAKEVTFLDTRVYVRDDLIGTDLHVKPTDTHQYLRMDSCHPYHCKTSIPYTKVLRLRRISKEDHLLKWTQEL